LTGVPLLPVAVRGTGSVTGSRVVTSAFLDELHGRPPGTTQAHSGVVSRPWVSPDQTSSMLAADAIRLALAAAQAEAVDLDAVIIAAAVAEQPMPTTAMLTLGHLGLEATNTVAFDVNASCLGFLAAFDVAALGIAAGRWRRVAVAATDIASVGLDHTDLDSSALFGDGAGAVVLEPADAGQGILAIRWETFPSGSALCGIPAGGTRWNISNPPERQTDYLFHMQGMGLTRLATKHLPRLVAETLDEAGLTADEIDVVIPHQASSLGMRYARERLGFHADKVVDILGDHGNQVSASLPTALDHAVRSGRLGPGRTALLLGTGAGVARAAMVLRT
jgi:3-oxoacyl-[acyl-carrier-protein] synthase-3